MRFAKVKFAQIAQTMVVKQWGVFIIQRFWCPKACQKYLSY